MSRNVVLLPVPEPPMIPTASPRLMVMLTPCRIFLLPKDLWTSFSSIRTSSCCLSCTGCVSAEPPNFGLGMVLTSLEVVAACAMTGHLHAIPWIYADTSAEKAGAVLGRILQKATQLENQPSWPQDVSQGEDLSSA